MSTATVAGERAQREPRRPLPVLDRVDLKWMAGLSAAALGLRLWVALSVGQTPPTVLNDPTVYQAIATNLAHGLGFVGIARQPTAQFPPAYPFLLSLVFRLFGVHRTAGALLNVLLSTATVPLLYVAARRALGRVEAVFVGIGMTVLLSQILYADLLLSDSLAIFETALLLALLPALDARRSSTPVILGVVLGVATLTRAVGFVLIVIPIAMWWGTVNRPLLMRQAGVMVGVALVFVVPWTIRNAVEMHGFIPLATDSAPTLWAGHNPAANGGPVAPSSRLLSSIHAPPASAQYELDEYRLLQSRAVSWAVRHPLDELRLIPLKLLALFDGDGQPISYWLNEPGAPRLLSHNAAVRLNTLADLAGYGLLAAFAASLAVFGRALWRRRPMLRGALAYLAVSAVLYGFVFFGFFRYLAGLEPLMLLVAAPLVGRLWSLRAQRLA